MTHQEILKMLHDEKRDIVFNLRIFLVRKARTCKNCEYVDYNTFCSPTGCAFFPTRINKSSKEGFVPDGYCVPIRGNWVNQGTSDYYWSGVTGKLNEIVSIYGDSLI